MINEDQEKQDEDKQSDENVPEKQSGSLDIQGSEYFTKYPKAIANPQVDSFLYFILYAFFYSTQAPDAF